jgi:ABC-type glucose/galactose transport system permease subunit
VGQDVLLHLENITKRFPGVLAVKLGLNPVFSLIMCLVFGSLLGLMNGLMLTKLRLPHPFISTMDMKQMARGIALAIIAAQPISGFDPSIAFLGSARAGPIPASLFLAAVLYIGMHLFLTRTATGRYIYAVGGNKEASRLSGVNVNGILNLVYTLSGFMAVLAGIVLVGRVDSAYPLAGTDYESDAIAAAIIGGASFFGGVGKIGDTIVGVLIIIDSPTPEDFTDYDAFIGVTNYTAGVDGARDALNSILRGELYGSMGQNSYQMGVLAVENAVKLMKGEVVEKRIDSGSTPLTLDNARTQIEFRDKIGG